MIPLRDIFETIIFAAFCFAVGADCGTIETARWMFLMSQSIPNGLPVRKKYLIRMAWGEALAKHPKGGWGMKGRMGDEKHKKGGGEVVKEV